MARAWYLKSRPQGTPTLDNFELKALPLPPLDAGMVHVLNHWLSVDPYMRGRMDDRASYVAPFALNEPLSGAAVGEVVASRSEDFAPGDLVLHGLGWRDEAVASAHAFTKLADRDVPEQLHLGILGMTGATAYFGLLHVGAAQSGETVFVSAAAGAVGSTVVQLAKIKRMRVVASAGGADKCALARELGADATVDYKSSGALVDKLAAAAPEGIDVYFDNVGGDHLDAALALANQHARIAVCGMIATYNSSDPVALHNLFRVIAARIRIEGFLVRDFHARFDAFRSEMKPWIADGRIATRETVMEGLEAAPSAFLSLFSGGNTGKMLVRL